MARKDITDVQVCMASLEYYQRPKDQRPIKFITHILMEWTGECEKVCERAIERACNRGLLDYGVSMRTAFLTEKGAELVGKPLAAEMLKAVPEKTRRPLMYAMGLVS